MASLKKRGGHLLRVGPSGSGHLVRACVVVDPCDLCGDGQADYTDIVITINVASPFCVDVNGTFGFSSLNFCDPFDPRIRDEVLCTIPAPDNRTVKYTWEFIPETGLFTFQEYIYFNYPSTSPLDVVYNTTIDLCPFTTDTYSINTDSTPSTMTITFS